MAVVFKKIKKTMHLKSTLNFNQWTCNECFQWSIFYLQKNTSSVNWASSKYEISWLSIIWKIPMGAPIDLLLPLILPSIQPSFDFYNIFLRVHIGGIIFHICMYVVHNMQAFDKLFEISFWIEASTLDQMGHVFCLI